jgi:hypothetical protein
MKRKNSHPLPGLEPPIIQPITQRYTIEPSRLREFDMKSKSRIKEKN